MALCRSEIFFRHVRRRIVNAVGLEKSLIRV